MYSIQGLDRYISYCRRLQLFANTVQPAIIAILLIAAVIVLVIGLTNYTSRKYKKYAKSLSVLLPSLATIIAILIVLLIMSYGHGDSPNLSQEPIRVAQQDKFIIQNKKERIPYLKRNKLRYNAFYNYDIKHPNSNLAKHQGTDYWQNKINKQNNRIKALKYVDQKGYNEGSIDYGLPEKYEKHLTTYSGSHQLPKITWNNRMFPFSRIGYVF